MSLVLCLLVVVRRRGKSDRPTRRMGARRHEPAPSAIRLPTTFSFPSPASPRQAMSQQANDTIASKHAAMTRLLHTLSQNQQVCVYIICERARRAPSLIGIGRVSTSDPDLAVHTRGLTVPLAASHVNQEPSMLILQPPQGPANSARKPLAAAVVPPERPTSPSGAPLRPTPTNEQWRWSRAAPGGGTNAAARDGH